MLRPFTCLTVLLAAGSGLYLYAEKHRTTLLDDRIRAVVAQTHQIEDRTSMLRAEWALLNQPDRLQTLAAKFLPQLQPMAPTQFVQASDLDKHLPPIGTPPAASPPTPSVPGPVTTPPVVLASATAKPAITAPPAPKPVIVRVALRARHRTMAPEPRPSQASLPLVRQVASYTPPRPMLAGAWRSSPAAPPFTGSALGMAHMAMPPPMAAR